MKIKRPESKQPMPKHAKRVFKGIQFDVYQWEQDLFDGTTTTFEKIRRADTVSIIPITTDQKIMVARQEQPGVAPFLSCFGGVIDEDEDPFASAKRELLEETGCNANEWMLWDAAQFIDKIDWALYTFIAKDCKKAQEQQLDPGERIEIQYLSFDEFLKTALQENFRDTEVSLKIARMIQHPEDIRNLKKLLGV